MPVDLKTDLLVVGAGLAGMSAAAYAAQHDARVTVVEKAPAIGGSTLLSGGLLWTADSADLVRDENPDADPELANALVDGFGGALEWMREQGLVQGEPFAMTALTGWPASAVTVDLVAALARWRRLVEQRDGWIAVGTTTRRLCTSEDGRVVGAVVEDRDGTTTIGAEGVVLATGGFQADAALRARYIGDLAASMLVRSNPHSTGDGLRLAVDVGAATARHMSGFYGHLVPYPLAIPFEPGAYLRLAQLYSGRCLLLDRAGHRILDESRGYYRNAQAVLRQAGSTALLVGDATIRERDRVGHIPGQEQIDRPAEARLAGANVAIAPTLPELDDAAAELGYRGVEAAVTAFNRTITSATSLEPPRQRFTDPIETPDFFAVEVQAAITFTHGGVPIDAQSRVLGDQGRPIPGLYAAGADAGGIYSGGYAGGLSTALVFGLGAARTMLADAAARVARST